MEGDTKQYIHYLSAPVQEVQDMEQTQELRISDGMPDIGRILAGWGQALLRGKQWDSDGVSLSAGAMVWVLYEPEEGGQPQIVESWIPMQLQWDLPEETPEGEMLAQVLLRFVDARCLSARKLSIRAGICAMMQALTPAQAELWQPEQEEGDIQLLTATYPMLLPVQAGEKSFLVDETLTLPASEPEMETLLYGAAEPVVTDKKLLGDKVIFRGFLRHHVLYRGEGGQLNSWDFEVPFSQFAPLEGSFSTDAQPVILTGVQSMEQELDEEGKLHLKCGILAQYLVRRMEAITVTEDAYSPTRELDIRWQELELPGVLEVKVHALSAEQEIAQPCKRVADTLFLPDQPRQRRTEDGVQWTMPGTFQLLCCAEDGTLQGVSTRWQGELSQKAGEDSILLCRILPGSPAQSRLTGDGVSARAEYAAELTTLSRAGIRMVCGVTPGQEMQPRENRPSLILCRAGEERLWDLAKKCGSTVSAISQANHLEGEPETGRMLLIPAYPNT